MSYEFLELSEVQNNVARLTLRREQKRNALSMAMRDELEQALAELAGNEGVHAVVLAGGESTFCAGFDLKEAAATAGRSFLHRLTEFFTACYLFPKPVVTAVEGAALGGGFDLALMGDFIVASTSAVFRHPEIAFGPVAVLPLARFVGPARVRELALLGEELDVQRAHALGIVHQIVDPGAAAAAATSLAERIAAHSPVGVKLTKRALDEWVLRALLDTDVAAVKQAVGDHST